MATEVHDGLNIPVGWSCLRCLLGIIIKKTGKTRLERPVLDAAAAEDEEGTAEDEERGEDACDVQAAELQEVSMLEEVGEFAELMVWGHDAVPDALDDPYMRGVREWVAFAGDVSGL